MSYPQQWSYGDSASTGYTYPQVNNPGYQVYPGQQPQAYPQDYSGSYPQGYNQPYGAGYPQYPGMEPSYPMVPPPGAGPMGMPGYPPMAPPPSYGYGAPPGPPPQSSSFPSFHPPAYDAPHAGGMSAPQGPGSYASGSSAYGGPPTHGVPTDMTCVGGVLSHGSPGPSMHTTAPPAVPSSSTDTLSQLLKLVGAGGSSGTTSGAPGTASPSIIDSFAHSLLGTKDKSAKDKSGKKEKKPKGVMADISAVQAFAAHHSDADLQRLLKLMLTGKSITEAMIALGESPVQPGMH